MERKKLLFYLVATLIFALSSCNNKKQTYNFYVNLDVVIQESDSIRVFYKTDGKINFNEKDAFWTKVKGSKKNQVINIKFPKNILPNQFRIDFGNNPIQPEIIINKLECVYKNNSFVLKGREVYLLLRVDENNTMLDKDLGLLKRKNLKQKNGPSLYPLGNKLKLRLEELTNKTKTDNR
ncbi:MAG: hypothetical protein H7174_01670 [Flavobacterium sp.]|nr:hypothetical protein [Flavobacterium sp.]